MSEVFSSSALEKDTPNSTLEEERSSLPETDVLEIRSTSEDIGIEANAYDETTTHQIIGAATDEEIKLDQSAFDVLEEEISSVNDEQLEKANQLSLNESASPMLDSQIVETDLKDAANTGELLLESNIVTSDLDLRSESGITEVPAYLANKDNFSGGLAKALSVNDNEDCQD